MMVAPEGILPGFYCRRGLYAGRHFFCQAIEPFELKLTYIYFVMKEKRKKKSDVNRNKCNIIILKEQRMASFLARVHSVKKYFSYY